MSGPSHETLSRATEEVNGASRQTFAERGWLNDLPAGLRPDFDYDVIHTVGDAVALVLSLPRDDRGAAAVWRHGTTTNAP